MRVLRRLLFVLFWILVGAALLIGILFTSPVQTWLFQRWMDRHHPGLHGSVDAISAGLSSVELDNLRLQVHGATLTFKQVDAQLPVWSAWRSGTFAIQHLATKGAVVDFSGRTLSVPASTNRSEKPETTPASQPVSVGALPEWIIRGTLPPDITIDQLEVEGDVFLANPSGGDPIGGHFSVTGNGPTPGHDSKLQLNSTIDVSQTTLPYQVLSVHGDVTTAVSPTRAIERFGFSGEISADAGSFAIQTTASLSRSSDDQTTRGELTVSRADHRVVGISATFDRLAGLVSGKWDLNVTDADLAALLPGRSLPANNASGQGTFERHADSALDLKGNVLADIPRSGLAPLGLGTFGARSRFLFDVTHRNSQLAIRQLTAVPLLPNQREPGTGSSLRFETAQPFTFDEHTGAITPSRPDRELLHVVVSDFPLASLFAKTGAIAIVDGTVSGELTVKPAGDGAVEVRSTKPLRGSQIAVAHAGAVVLRNLDASATLTGSRTAAAPWEFRLESLTAAFGGRPLATAKAKLNLLNGSERLFSISGSTRVDLDALAAAVPGRVDWIRGRSATADFSGTVGPATDLNVNVTATGHDPAKSLSIALAVSIDDYRNATLHVPIKLTLGKETTDGLIEGTWSHGADADQVDLQVTSPKLRLEDLKLAAASDLHPTTNGGLTLPGVPGRSPWWGRVNGRMRVDINEVDIGDDRLDQVGGTFDLSPTTLRLNGGGAVFMPISMKHVDRLRESDPRQEPRSMLSLEGTINFTPGASIPYTLTAKAGIDTFDAKRLFGPPPQDTDPVFEGKWSVSDAVTATGSTPAELWSHRQDKLEFTSKEGVLRLLKTNVGAALPDAATPVSDAASNVGSAVGYLFGVERRAATNRVSKKVQAVLDFSYDVAEIGYTSLTVTAMRDATGAIHLSNLAAIGPKEHLTGSGEIAPAAGRPIWARPLQLDLQLGVRGITANRLATAGLLAPEKDSLGFSRLAPPIRLRGALDKIDDSEWRALLAKAAVAP